MGQAGTLHFEIQQSLRLCFAGLLPQTGLQQIRVGDWLFSSVKHQQYQAITGGGEQGSKASRGRAPILENQVTAGSAE